MTTIFARSTTTDSNTPFTSLIATLTFITVASYAFLQSNTALAQPEPIPVPTWTVLEGLPLGDPHYEMEISPEVVIAGDPVLLTFTPKAFACGPVLCCGSVALNGSEWNESGERYRISVEADATTANSCDLAPPFTLALDAPDASDFEIEVFRENDLAGAPTYDADSSRGKLLVFAMEPVQTEFYAIAVAPKSPNIREDIQLEFRRWDGGESWCMFFNHGMQIDYVNRVIRVSIGSNNLSFTGCPGTDPAVAPIGQLEASGAYYIEVYDEGDDPDSIFGEDNRVATFPVSLESPSDTYVVETPAANSRQSGVGVVRGWACDASVVEVQFDDEPRMKVAYGSSRADTSGVCGDENNGYGLVIAWGILGAGEHRMRTYIDGRNVGDVTFEVVSSDADFLTGLEGSFELDDFPAPGESVVVEWSEAAQNFVIVEFKN